MVRSKMKKDKVKDRLRLQFPSSCGFCTCSISSFTRNVLREGNVQRSLLKTIKKRQMEFLGHLCRRRGLEFLSLTGKVECKRDRGKQRITFLDSLCNSATGGQSKGLNFLKLSDDRDVWRGMAANVCSRSGT